MKIEKLKRFNKWKWIGITVILCIICIIISVKGTQAKYRFTASYPAAYGTIHWKMGDLEVLAVNLENDGGWYDSSDTIPTSGYALNEEKSYCGLSNGDGTYTHDENITITYENGEVTIGKITTKGTKCFLYFDIYFSQRTISDIIASFNLDITRTYVIPNSTFTEYTAGTIFEGPADDYGDKTYYFAGSEPSNWVKFGTYKNDLYYGYTNDGGLEFFTDETECSSYDGCTLAHEAGEDLIWQIIRVNGNGSIRLMYYGTESRDYPESDWLDSSSYTSCVADNACVGYMYGTTGSDNYSDTHANLNDSTIKNTLDAWYINVMSPYSSFLDMDVGFCGDRSISSVSSGLGYGTETTDYLGFDRLSGIDDSVSYMCPNSNNDLYTVYSSNYGNKALTYPIGLITADEVAFAGAKFCEYSDCSLDGYYWLSNRGLWTMTPSNYYDRESVYVADVKGRIRENIEDTDGGRRTIAPVINLKSDTVFTSGVGTWSSPFVVG